VDELPFIGREREFEAIERALSGVAAGPCLVDLPGEPGVGKSRMLSEIAERAGQSRVTVVSAGTDGPVSPGEFANLRDLFAAVPVPDPAAGSFRPPDQADAAAWHLSLRAAVAALVGRAGAMIVLDDLHLMDRGSAEVLAAYLRRPPQAPVLLVLSYRSRQCDPRLRAALVAARRSSRVTSIELGPLDRTETDAFIGDTMCGRHRRTAYQDSGGNPKYLRLLMAKCLGELSPQAEVNDVMTRESAPMLAELADLSQTARLVANAAAVIGDRFEPELLQAVGRLGHDEVLGALDDLIASDVIRPSTVPGHFDFRHPLLRDLVYQATPGGWRLGAHARAAAEMRRIHQPAERYAQHLEMASTFGDEQSVTALTEAAHLAVPVAPAQAAHWYDTALRLLPDSDRTLHWRRQVLLRLARANAAAGRPAPCRAALDDWSRAAAEASAAKAEITEAARLRARLAEWSGDHALAIDILRTAIGSEGESSADGDTELRVALAATAARGAMAGSGHVADTMTWAQDAVLSAAGSGDPVCRASALVSHATLSLVSGDAAAARRGAHAAARLIDPLADAAVAPDVDVLAALAWLELRLENFPSALSHFARGATISQAAGKDAAAATLAVGLGAVLMGRGQLRRARSLADQALELSGAEGLDEPRTAARWLRGRIALQAGDTAGAMAEAAAATTSAATGPWWHRVRLVLAEALLADGDAEACHATLAAAGLDDWAGAPLPIWDQMELADLLGRAAIHDGRRADGELAAKWLEAIADSLDLPGARATAALAAAWVSETPAAALSCYLTVITTASGCDHPYQAGQANLGAGLALRELKSPDRADHHLQLAADLAADHGFAGLAADVAAARKAPAGPADVPTQFVLSQREFEIAQLVSTGRTNRQIARSLAVSHKTVETHLGRIFQKLDVSSRAEIANMVGRATITGRPRRRAAVS
jgi:DNA-binding NarL/FixJ family response regulator